MSHATKKTSGAEGFDQIYGEFASMVRAVAFRMARADLVDDIVQETFLRVWKSRSSFAGRSSLKTWIYRIAVNTAIDHMRKSSRNVLRLVSNDETQIVDANGGDQVASKDLVTKALATLSDDYRATLVLHVFEGLQIKQISEVLELPQGTIKSRLKRAREKLMDYLESQGVQI